MIRSSEIYRSISVRKHDINSVVALAIALKIQIIVGRRAAADGWACSDMMTSLHLEAYSFIKPL